MRQDGTLGLGLLAREGRARQESRKAARKAKLTRQEKEGRKECVAEGAGSLEHVAKRLRAEFTWTLGRRRTTRIKDGIRHGSVAGASGAGGWHRWK